MGQQQLLLIILGVIIVGIAIAVGLGMFTAQSVGSNKDAIIADFTNLAANAYQYRIRSVAMGGGGGSTYMGYTIPTSLSDNENATYTVITTDASSITFKGISKQDPNNLIEGKYGPEGKLSGVFTFSGAFQ
jgi:type II secretory pathway pseudopilin PulG